MAGRIGEMFESFVSKEENSTTSSDLNSFEVYAFQPLVYNLETPETLGGKRSVYRMAKANTWGRLGELAKNFLQDFYFRIHVDPIELDLQTVASSQTRQFSVWNAFPYTTANVDEISIENGAGLTITGQEAPFSMLPLLELSFDVSIEVTGPPNIDSNVQFVFTNVDNPLPVHIVGTRAIKFDIAPEQPVIEVWQWLTDSMTAVDGSEQRISLRGEVPRTESKIKVLFDNLDDLNAFYSTFISAKGRVWLPEFQYATKITNPSLNTETTIYFDSSKTDVRDGEYVLIQTGLNSVLVQLDEVFENSASLISPLTFDIPLGSFIIPGSAAILDENQTLKRSTLDNIAELNLSASYVRNRTELERLTSYITLDTFKSIPILDKRPLSNSTLDDAVSTGQIKIDNGIGLLDSVSRWSYSRIGGKRSFQVKRVQNALEMDYWKAFFAYLKGDAKKFFIPTFRNDLQIVGTLGESASSCFVKGPEYAEKIFDIPTHRFIEIETTAGIHRTELTGASVIDSNSILAFETNVPSGEGWTEVKRISYILPCRLDGDVVNWSHYAHESIVEFSIRSAEYE